MMLFASQFDETSRSQYKKGSENYKANPNLFYKDMVNMIHD